MRLFEVLRHPARNARCTQRLGDLVRARPRPSAIFSQHHRPVGNVPDSPRRDPIQAHEAESAHRFFRPDYGGDGRFVAQAVLQGQERRLRAAQGGQQLRQRVIGGRFKAHQHHVRRADLLRSACAARPHVKASLHALDVDALPARYFKIRPQKKMRLVPRPAQFGAVEAPQRAASDHRDFHGATNHAGGRFDNQKVAPPRA